MSQIYTAKTIVEHVKNLKGLPHFNMKSATYPSKSQRVIIFFAKKKNAFQLTEDVDVENDDVNIIKYSVTLANFGYHFESLDDHSANYYLPFNENARLQVSNHK